jgi:hypothetical protein
MTELQSDDARRFGGLERLYGVTAAQRLRQAHVVVVGIGGVGSWSAEALARSGIARLTLIDMDHIAESNVNRQIHALSSTLGQAKIEAMRERIALIHPTCRVDVIDDFVSPDNWPGLLSERPDAVIDACDQVRAKQAMAAWALREKMPFGWRTRWTWTTWRTSRTTRCWRSCVTSCANTMVRPSRANASACAACSAARRCKGLTRRARWKVTAASTVMATALWWASRPPLACALPPK